MRKIEAVLIKNLLFAVQVFKDFVALRTKLDDEAWAGRATNNAGEPLVPPDPSPIKSLLEINTRNKGRRTGGSPSHKEPPEDQPVGSPSDVRAVRPPKTSVPTRVKSAQAKGPSYRRVASASAEGNLRLEKGEMPEIPEDTYVTQEDAVEYLEAKETQEERKAVRHISSEFKNMREAMTSAVAMCEDYDVSFVYASFLWKIFK